jgi:predicted SprT family Zn-dependent metalloprotease
MGAEYRCSCGAVLRYKQDIRKEQGDVYRAWKCRQCGTELPGSVGERLSHRDPS